MARQRQSTTSDRLKELRERISRWRLTFPKRRPMPAPLWDEAVALARELGVHPVKAALGLNYESLKTRLDEATSHGHGAQSGAGVDFVELSGAQLLGLPVAAGPVVELSDASGGRLTMRLAAGSALDVAQLVAAFRGRQA
jgi:hypothetical protein